MLAAIHTLRYCTDGPAYLAKFGASTCESSYAGRVAAHKGEDSIHYIALSLSTLGLEVGKRVVVWCSRWLTPQCYRRRALQIEREALLWRQQRPCLESLPVEPFEPRTLLQLV